MLRALVANNNQIEDITALGSAARVLECLIVSHNRIARVDVLCQLPALRKISLSHNLLQDLPNLTQSLSLREMRLAYNNLSALPRNMLPSSLEILDLGHNCITRLAEVNILEDCPLLRNLNLAGNPCVPSPPQGYYLDAELAPTKHADVDETSGPYAQYRAAVLKWCPNLRILDGKKLPAALVQEGAVRGGAARRTPDCREIFISNLPWGMSEGHVRRFFNDLGPRAVRSVQLLRHKSRRVNPRASGVQDKGTQRLSKGAAFVKFRSRELANQALKFANRTVTGRGRETTRVVVREAMVRMSWRDCHGIWPCACLMYNTTLKK